MLKKLFLYTTSLMLYTIPRYWKLPRQYMATYRRPVIVIRHLNTGLLFL